MDDGVDDALADDVDDSVGEVVACGGVAVEDVACGADAAHGTHLCVK